MIKSLTDALWTILFEQAWWIRVLIGAALGALFLGGTPILVQLAKKPEPAKPPLESSDPTGIYQAGIVVGKAFGARRRVNDATTFEFAEITQAGQFNTTVPFTYNGIRMQLFSEEHSALMVIGRFQDGPIRFGVVAKVLD